MDIAEQHRYAAAALMGMSILGEGALIFQMSSATVFSVTILGGVAGIYFYSYGYNEEEGK